VLGPNGEVTAIIHRVEDVTNSAHLRSDGEASVQILLASSKARRAP
jgi:hypothetical protein